MIGFCSRSPARSSLVRGSGDVLMLTRDRAAEIERRAAALRDSVNAARAGLSDPHAGRGSVAVELLLDAAFARCDELIAVLPLHGLAERAS